VTGRGGGVLWVLGASALLALGRAAPAEDESERTLTITEGGEIPEPAGATDDGDEAE